MAIMIPDSCPSRATAGEKRTYGLLRDLLCDGCRACAGLLWIERVAAGVDAS